MEITHNSYPEDAEQFYDEHIAPQLLELAEKCEQKGLSLVAVVEYKPDPNPEEDDGSSRYDNRGITLAMAPHASESFKRMKEAAFGRASMMALTLTTKPKDDIEA